VVSSILSRSISRRRALATAAGAAGAVAIGAAGASAAAQGGDAGAGFAYGGQMTEGIVVTGSGTASAGVTAALVQYLLRYGPDAPQIMEATPEEMSKGYYSGSYPAPDEDAMAHVVEALTGAGIPEANVKTFPGSDTMYGLFGAGVSVVAASIDDPDLLASLGDILSAGADAVAETNLAIDQIGAIYSTDDCEAVNDDALAAAAADANTQAAALAKALGVELGDLVGATSSPSYSPYSGYSGGSGACAPAPTLDDAAATYFPAFIAGATPEFTITASITLTFALGAAE
jgi:uncharacterized protein YggE